MGQTRRCWGKGSHASSASDSTSDQSRVFRYVGGSSFPGPTALLNPGLGTRMNAMSAASSDAHISRFNAYTSARLRSRRVSPSALASSSFRRRCSSSTRTRSALALAASRDVFSRRAASLATAASRASFSSAARVSSSRTRAACAARVRVDASALLTLRSRTLSAAADAADAAVASAASRSRATASAVAFARVRASSLADLTRAAAAAAAAAATSPETRDFTAAAADIARALAAASSRADLTLAAAAAAALAASAAGESDALRTRAGRAVEPARDGDDEWNRGAFVAFTSIEVVIEVVIAGVIAGVLSGILSGVPALALVDSLTTSPARAPVTGRTLVTVDTRPEVRAGTTTWFGLGRTSGDMAVALNGLTDGATDGLVVISAADPDEAEGGVGAATVGAVPHADVADACWLGRGLGTTRGWVLAVGTGDGLLDRPYIRFDV